MTGIHNIALACASAAAVLGLACSAQGQDSGVMISGGRMTEPPPTLSLPYAAPPLPAADPPRPPVIVAAPVDGLPGLTGGRFVFGADQEEKWLTYYRLADSDTPNAGGRGEAWLVGVYRQPFTLSNGQDISVLGMLFSFDCRRRTGHDKMTVFLKGDLTEESRLEGEALDGPVNPNSPRGAVMRIACDGFKPGGEPLDGLQAMMTDARRRLKR